MNKIKKTTVECNSLKSLLAEMQCPMDYKSARRMLFDKYETTNIEYWQLIDFFDENKIECISKLDTATYLDIYDDLQDYPIAIFS